MEKLRNLTNDYQKNRNIGFLCSYISIFLCEKEYKYNKSYFFKFPNKINTKEIENHKFVDFGLYIFEHKMFKLFVVCKKKYDFREITCDLCSPTPSSCTNLKFLFSNLRRLVSFLSLLIRTFL